VSPPTIAGIRLVAGSIYRARHAPKPIRDEGLQDLFVSGVQVDSIVCARIQE
jgi:hypothetical protein